MPTQLGVLQQYILVAQQRPCHEDVVFAATEASSAGSGFGAPARWPEASPVSAAAAASVGGGDAEAEGGGAEADGAAAGQGAADILALIYYFVALGIRF